MTFPGIPALDHVERLPGTPLLVTLMRARNPLTVLQWRIPHGCPAAGAGVRRTLETALARRWRSLVPPSDDGLRIRFTVTATAVEVTAKLTSRGTAALVAALTEVFSRPFRAVPAAASERPVSALEQAHTAAWHLHTGNPPSTVDDSTVPLAFARSTLAVVGTTDPAALRHILDQAAFPADLGPFPEEQAPRAAPGLHLLPLHGSGNAVVLLAAPAPGRGEPGLAAAETVAAMLGGGLGSSLHRHLRDACGITYGGTARIRQRGGHGLLAAAVPVRATDLLRALTELRTVLERTLETAPPAARITVAAQLVAGSVAISLDDSAGLAGYLAAVEPVPGAQFVNTHLAELTAVSREAVAAARDRLLGPRRLATVVLAPSEVLDVVRRKGTPA
jgi:hypothetical protein